MTDVKTVVEETIETPHLTGRGELVPVLEDPYKNMDQAEVIRWLINNDTLKLYEVIGGLSLGEFEVLSKVMSDVRG